MIIQHVVPLDDRRDHVLKTEPGEVLGTDVLVCNCPCVARVVFSKSGNPIWVHASFDGREGLEEALELIGGELPEGHLQWGIFNEEK